MAHHTISLNEKVNLVDKAKPCPLCKGKRTVLMSKDNVVVESVLDGQPATSVSCPTCRGSGQVGDLPPANTAKSAQ
jgi:hypothetical protein